MLRAARDPRPPPPPLPAEANLDAATLIPTPTPGLDLSRELYSAELTGGNKHSLALAGLRPWLIEQQGTLGGHILESSFTSVQQSIGVPRNDEDEAQAEVVALLGEFVEDAKREGMVERLIERHGAVGKLSVAPLL